MDDLEFLETLRDTFFEEADDLLSKMEVLFLEMENDLSDTTSLESIFRYIHTLKGSAKSVSFRDFGALAHDVENVLVKLKSGELKVTKEIVDVLLESNDALTSMVTELKQDGDASFDSSKLRDKLNLFFVQASFDESPVGAEHPTEAKESTEEELENFDVNQHVEYEHSEEGSSSEDDEGGLCFFDDEPTDIHPMVQDALNADAPPKAPVQPEQPALEKKPEKKEDGRKNKATEEFIRLPLQKLDSLLNTFGEQVILQSILEHNKEHLTENSEMIKKIINQLSKITLDLQHSTMSLRMVRVKGLFNKIQRLARDTANGLNKKVQVNFIGENTEIDKSLADELSIAITHIIRNSIDHGIEMPDERKKLQKSEYGGIDIHAYQENGFFYLKINDDGRGLDREKILSIAVSKGLVKPDAKLTDQEIYKLIFMAGFSTAAVVTDVSGRGVGMDAVMNVVTDAKGQIQVDSVSGKGTQILLKLPLSMTIFNGTIIRTDNEKFIVPNSDISEVFQFKDSQVRNLDNEERVVLKGDHTISLINFDRAIGRKSTKKNENKRKTAIIVKKDHREVALEVDEILGQQRVVLKKIGAEVEKIPGVSGGAILSDGKVALVLNINALAS